MTACILLVSALAVGQAPVEVKILSGDAKRGSLVSMTAEQMVIDVAEGRQTISVKDVLRINAVKTGASPAPSLVDASVWIELIDGSTVIGTSFQVTGGEVTVGLLDDSGNEFGVSGIRTVRLKPHEGPDQMALQQQWSDILKEPAKDDVLIIRKVTSIPREDGNPPKNVVALDYLGGVLHDVSDTKVTFEFEGEKIDVPREKVEGMAYYRRAGAALPEPIGRIRDSFGNVWNVTAVTAAGGELKFETPSGVGGHGTALESIDEIDFSAGKLVYLSDLKPEKSEYTPYIEAKKTPTEAIFNQPRFDRTLDGQPLRIGETTYAKGVALRSRTRITWRVPPSFRRLLATAGIDYHADASGGASGDVQLIVLGDDKPLFDQRVTGRDGPVELDVDVTGVKRLTVLVDYGGGIDTGDYLDLGDARVTK